MDRADTFLTTMEDQDWGANNRTWPEPSPIEALAARHRQMWRAMDRDVREEVNQAFYKWVCEREHRGVR